MEAFRGGQALGLPPLQGMGLTIDGCTAAERGTAPFPPMQRWLCEEPTPD